MKIITFLPSHEDTASLRRSLKSQMPHVEFVQAQTLEQLMARMAQPQPVGTIAVILIDSTKTLEKLSAIQFALERYRLILILDTSDRAVVEQAHHLYPRVVVDRASAGAEVPQIVLHMHRPSPPVASTRGIGKHRHAGH